jgi:hypothetical protein
VSAVLILGAFVCGGVIAGALLAAVVDVLTGPW